MISGGGEGALGAVVSPGGLPVEPGPQDPQEQALFHKDQVIRAWLGRQKNRITDCNIGNCFCPLLPLPSAPTLPTEDSGRHFCKEGQERASVGRPQPTQLSFLSFSSCAPTAGAGLGALRSESSLQPGQMGLHAPLGEQSIHGCLSEVSAHYEPSQKGFLASAEERDGEVEIRKNFLRAKGL